VGRRHMTAPSMLGTNLYRTVSRWLEGSRWLGCVIGMGCLIGGVAWGQAPAESPSVFAELRPVNMSVQVGDPVWVDFVIHNPTDKPVELRVPDLDADSNDGAAMGLPLSHVFSTDILRVVEMVSVPGSPIGDPVSESKVRAPRFERSPVLSLAPGGSVGRRVALAELCPTLYRPGTYRLHWNPYGGKIAAPFVDVTVASRKQAIISTDFGRMTIRFEYGRAPKHVENFIELAQRGFYDTTLMHRLLPGFLVQGGDPRGDGTGVRPDGVKLKAELSDAPFVKGTLAMARKLDDLDSASCQFFICLDRVPEFDGKYSVFGTLDGAESIETLNRIAQVRTDHRDRPTEPLYIRSVTIQAVRAEPAALTRRPPTPDQLQPSTVGTSTQPVPRAPVIAIKTNGTPVDPTSPAVAPDEE